MTIPMTQWASHLIQSMWESMLSATQLGTYTKFTPKQKATTLAILHVPSTSLANWPYHIGSYRIWGVYTASDVVMSLRET